LKNNYEILYVLPWGQMSLWGIFYAQNDTIINDSGIMSNIIIQSKIRATHRVGPHNKNILEYIYGSLLGDGFLERHGNGTRLCLQQEYSHKDYLEWLHLYLSSLGYTNIKIPSIQIRIGLKGKKRYILRFKTWTYSNLNYLHEEWYKNNIKILPSNIAEYITPLSLAIWIMDDGSRSGKGLKLATNNFTYLECEILANILRKKFNLIVSIHKTGHIDQWNLYIHKISIS
jgi:ubiquinol-cytochrome c reductase cytochrome b subunit